MTQVKIPITIIDDGSLIGEIYHPGKPDQFDWQAGNSAASILQGVRSVWNNLAHYINSAQLFDGYERKLQYKAALCELKILVDILPSFHSCLMKQNVLSEEEVRQVPSIAIEEKKVLGSKYKTYCQNRDVKESKLSEIRNNIGAHFADPQLKADKKQQKQDRVGTRKKISWEEIECLWDGIEVSDFKDMILSLQDYIDFASQLEIYEFYRKETNGIIRTHIPYIVHKDGFIYLGSTELLGRMGFDTEEKIESFIQNSRP